MRSLHQRLLPRLHTFDVFLFFRRFIQDFSCYLKDMLLFVQLQDISTSQDLSIATGTELCH